MKLKRAEQAIIMITLAFVCFTGGFFVGRGRSVNVVSVSPSVQTHVRSPSIPQASGGSVSPAAGVLLDLNSATADELAELPGIGKVLAERIIRYREEHDGFSAVSGVMDVEGIGEAKYLAVKDCLTVSGKI